MIVCILIIVLALLWLTKETDYFRVRLLIGDMPDPVQRESWDVLKTIALRIPDKQKPFWLKNPDLMEPLCGLAWLENTMHVVPEYKIELINCVHKYTIRSNNASCLRDAFRVYRNPYLKVKV